jgi:hypothetical protein
MSPESYHKLEKRTEQYQSRMARADEASDGRSVSR